MRTLFERVLLLKKSSVFQEVETQDLGDVARMLQETSFATGDTIFEMGDRGDQMYILLSGKIGISMHRDPAIKRYLAILQVGESFGEMGVLDDHPRSASAHVLEDTRLLILEKAQLRQLIIRHPELAFGILRSLSNRLRQAQTG